MVLDGSTENAQALRHSSGVFLGANAIQSLQNGMLSPFAGSLAYKPFSLAYNANDADLYFAVSLCRKPGALFQVARQKGYVSWTVPDFLGDVAEGKALQRLKSRAWRINNCPELCGEWEKRPQDAYGCEDESEVVGNG
eukprot:1145634-Pelagomonas_calceolata.AAC.1